MSNNIAPSLIVAAAILAASWMIRPTPTRQVDSLLSQLEESTHKKDSAGKTQLARIAEGLSQSVSSGFSSGFNNGQDDRTRQELAARDGLSIRDVSLVPSQMKQQERLIGVVRNTGKDTLTDIRLNVIFNDAEGHVMDVSSSFANIQGILKPNDELGFSVDHSLGEFNEKPEVLASRKAASAKVSIASLHVVK